MKLLQFVIKHREDILLNVLIFLAIFIGYILNLFGALDAAINKDQTVYNNLITSSLTLAGLAVAAIAFAQQNPEIRKHLIRPTIFFLLSSLLMYANIVAAGFSKLNIDVTKDNILSSVFGFYFLLGALGTTLLFVAIAYLIFGIYKIGSESNSPVSE